MKQVRMENGEVVDVEDDEEHLGDGPGEWRENNPDAEEFFDTGEEDADAN